MKLLMRAAIVGTAATLALAGTGLAGTAMATPSGAAPVVADRPHPPPGPPGPPDPRPAPPPHHFFHKFRSKADCEDLGRRDHPRDQWECRGGPDRDQPWELWVR